MKIILIVISAATVLAACSTTANRPDPANDEATKAKLAVYMECVSKNLDSVDDGVSDARTVATALAQLCQREHGAYVDAFVAADGLTDYQAQMVKLRQSDIDGRTDRLVPVVLKYRVMRTASANAKPAP